ncbi:MAG: metal-dependent hydrolase [Bryobacterales bacterium]
MTQFLLGAAIGGAMLGPQAGRKALLWGGVCGTLPDLDVFIPRSDPVAELTYHRAATHAVFFLTLATPLIALLIERIHPELRRVRGRWWLTVWLCLATHPLLDCFTVYGTQILLPFSDYPVAWSTIFIIDPLYTIPLAVAVILSLRRVSTRGAHAARLCMIALALSSAYLLATVAIKARVDSVTRASLRSQQIPAETFLATPAFFNTVLWRVIVMTPDGYLEGYYSLLDSSGRIEFSAHPNNPSLLAPIHDNWAVARLRWFTRGFYRVQETAEGITMADLRMGSEPSYIFSFRVGARSNGQVVPVLVQREPTPGVPPGTLNWAWRRMWGLGDE